MRRDQPGDGRFDLTRLCRIGRHQPRGALDDSEPPEEFALRYRPVAGETGIVQDGGEGSKVDLQRQVCFTRRGERVGVAMRGDGLQRVAEARPVVTVVDEETGAGRTDGCQFAGEVG